MDMCQSQVKGPKWLKWSYVYQIVQHSISFRLRPKQARFADLGKGYAACGETRN